MWMCFDLGFWRTRWREDLFFFFWRGRAMFWGFLETTLRGRSDEFSRPQLFSPIGPLIFYHRVIQVPHSPHVRILIWR